MKVTEPSVWEAMVWAVNQVVPDVPEDRKPDFGLAMMVDYQEILERKKEVLSGILLDDDYDETAREEALRLAKRTKRLDKGESS